MLLVELKFQLVLSMISFWVFLVEHCGSFCGENACRIFIFYPRKIVWQKYNFPKNYSQLKSCFCEVIFSCHEQVVSLNQLQMWLIDITRKIKFECLSRRLLYHWRYLSWLDFLFSENSGRKIDIPQIRLWLK